MTTSYVSSLLLALCFLHMHSMYAQPMLSYTDPQGDLYVSDSGRLVHLEHMPIRSIQYAANSIAYLDNDGELNYYARHKQQLLDVTNPSFYSNTDYYLYYANGGSFSVYDGKERRYLGYIQNHPYAFGDSLAAIHDFSGYFYVYEQGMLIELEQQPVLRVTAGDNTLAYINHIGQFRVYLHGEQMDVDSYAPIAFQAAANTVAYIDNYNYLKVLWNGEITELTHFAQINCLSTIINDEPELASYCNGPVVVNVESGLPVFKTGDELVAYIDDEENFYVYSKGVLTKLEDQIPEQYTVIDNLLWYVDGNGFLKAFLNGELHVVETYLPKNIKADKNTLVYTDLDNRLKAFYNGKKMSVSENIIQSFELNNNMVMYSDMPNKYKFFILR